MLQTIKEMELELEMIFNKGAVMILPTGLNKATGLRDRAMISLLYATGIRVSELIGLRVSDLDEQEGRPPGDPRGSRDGLVPPVVSPRAVGQSGEPLGGTRGG